MRIEGMHYFFLYSTYTKKYQKAPAGFTIQPKIPCQCFGTLRKSGRIKLPHGQKRGENFKVFYGLDTIQSRAFFLLTLGFTMDKIKLAEKAEILPPGKRNAFLSILS
jgi:hypothetical protein